MTAKGALRVRPYQHDDAPRWDEFLARAYMATFLHSRRFIAYHRERFVDRSLLLFRDESLVALFPAAVSPQDGEMVVSHPGTTYGGLLHEGHLRGAAMIEALRAVSAHYRECGYKYLRYKAIPTFYQRVPAQDDLYALFRCGAVRTRCDLSSCIDLDFRLPVSTRRRRAWNKALRSGMAVSAGAEHLPAFWSVLADNLSQRHGAKPTHSLAEIQEIAALFPEEVRFAFAMLDGQVEAGVVLFCAPRVHHAQYIGSSAMGREHNLLDALFEHCIEASRRAGARYFDFGISTESEGKALNEGLNAFKTEFGGGGAVHEFYDLGLHGGEAP